MMKIKKVLQTDLKDCGVSCLMSIINYYGGYARREYLREITKTTKDGVSVYSMVECAKTLGFEAKAVKGNIKNIENEVPIVAHVLKDNKLGHFVVVYEISSKTIKVMDPSCGFKIYSIEEWENITTNVYILYRPKSSILKQTKEKNLRETLVPILLKYKMTFIIVTVFSLIYTVSEILIAYGIKSLVNISIVKIKYLLILLILILVLKELTNLFRNYLINYLNHSLDNTFLKEIYNHIIRLPYLYFKNRTKGDIITRLNDVFKIRDLISKLFVTIFIDLIFIIIILGFIFSINFKIGIITLMISMIYILIVIFFNNILTKKIKSLKEKEVLVNNHLIESISSIETIKGMVIEDMLDEKLEFKYSNLQEESFSLNQKVYQELFLKNVVINLGLIIIIYLGIIDIFHHNISELLVLYNLYLCYITPLNNIAMLHLEYKDASISFIRIKELLNIEEEYLNIDKKTLDKRILGNININNLEYSYNGIDDIIKCKQLSIKNASKVLLYGNSGEGKSTLMKLLNRYLDNYKGEILIDNRDIKTYNLLDIRKKITYLSKDEIIYTDTIYNNIVLDNKVSYSKYLNIIKMCGIDEILKRSILSDEMMLENNGCNLSSGERERIIIARCLVKDSDIYIFDEATSSLDVKSERIILTKIFKYLKNKTVIVISHRFNNLDLYQKFITIKGGIVYDN